MPFLKKRPWIAVALVVACICMWGCGLLDDEERFVVDKNRTNGYLVAIIDDSLAIMETIRAPTENPTISLGALKNFILRTGKSFLFSFRLVSCSFLHRSRIALILLFIRALKFSR